MSFFSTFFRFSARARPSRGGFLATVAAIMIAVLVMVVVTVLGLISFLSRANISSTYYKEASRALARACLETALLKLSQNPSYSGDETVPLGSAQCVIRSVELQGANKIVKAQAVLQGTTTNLTLTVDGNDLSLVTIEEVKSF